MLQSLDVRGCCLQYVMSCTKFLARLTDSVFRLALAAELFAAVWLPAKAVDLGGVEASA